MNGLNGWDGKSVLIGGALALGGLVAMKGGLLPLLVVGGLVYFVGTKQGWWGHDPRRPGSDPMRRRPPEGLPDFAEWHRQAHAADQTMASHQPPAPAQPREAGVRIPVTPAPTAPETGDRRRIGETGAPLA